MSPQPVRPTKKTTQPSRYSLHVQKWTNGCGSEICEKAVKRVLGRGTIPCDILFLGEAPGRNENLIGLPFVGPAGKLLDEIILRAVPTKLTWAMTNLVGCIPLDDDGEKVAEPNKDDVVCCQGRLKEFILMAQPKLVVRLGKQAQHWFQSEYKKSLKIDPDNPIPTVDVVHPAAILRSNEAQQGIACQRAIVTIQDAIERLHLGS